MLPLIGLAISLVPELIRLIGGDKTDALATSVSHAVSAVTGTADETEARTRLQDPAVASALRTRLTELALAAQKAQADAASASRQIELAQVKSLVTEQTVASKAALDRLTVELTNTQNARATLAQLASSGSNVAWAAPALSIVIAVGFFSVLGLAVFGGRAITDSNKEITYTLIGTMATAFATMISFWLGSSQGSRNKDDVARKLQLSHADQTSSLISQLQRQAPAPPVLRAAASGPTLSSNFIPCLHEVLCLEGGYANDPRDPGGPTNFGITRAELADVRQVPIDSISPADMQALTLAEAASIYRKRYWNAMSCDDLAHGVDLMVFQFGVNAGIDASGRVLQRATGASVDGIIGPVTLAAANRMAPATLVQSLAAAQLVQYRGFAQWDEYGTGWTNRVDAATKAALAMAAT